MMRSGNPLDDSDNRRRRRQERGIDLPPSITGPSINKNHSWENLDLETQPLHRLCTLGTGMEGTSICPPMVVFQRYIASVSGEHGYLKLYELQSDWIGQAPLTQVLPKYKCQVTTSHQQDTARIVAITSLDHLQADDRLLYIILATCEGDVHIVQVFDAEEQPRLAHSFNTKLLNVVSAACWVEDNSMHIGIGTKSGIIEEWKISTDWQHEVRVWKGSFHTPLHSLVTVPMGKNTHRLSACISQRPRMGLALQSSTVEVLNRSKIRADWKEDDVLSLTDYCQWPDAGREWQRAAETGEGVAFGSNILCRVGESSWAAALVDGSVGILASFHDSSSWGVMPYARQATLSYPAIGMGVLNLPNGPHLACCLRGGTIYCLSIDYNEDNESSIPVFLPPFEGEEDDFEFLHGFAAGNIRMKSASASYGAVRTESMPIVVYSGEGGTMEVFACGLLPSVNPEVEKQVVMRQMVENGTAQMLVEGLRDMADDAKLLEDILWSKAREECRGEEITVDTVMTNHTHRFENTHALLLSLAA